MGAVKAVISFVWDLLYFLTGEGSWKLRDHERIVLEAAISSLTDDVRIRFLEQMNGRIFIQRSHKQISRPRFYTPFCFATQNVVEGGDLAHKLICVQITVDGKKESAQVEFFQGRIDSIQFKRPGRFYIGKTINVIGLKSGNPSLSHAAAIDRCEHGRTDQEHDE